MTKGYETQQRLIAEQPPPQTDPQWWLGWLTAFQLVSLCWLVKEVYLPIMKLIL